MTEVQVERQAMQRIAKTLGEEWVQAVLEKDFQRLTTLCQPYLRSRLLTPSRFTSFENAGDLAAKVAQWFGGYSAMQSEQVRVDLVGERLGIFYRLRVREDGQWETVEQQLYASLKDGLLDQLQLLCSGFHPSAAGDAGQVEEAAAATGQQPPARRDALLEIDTRTANSDSTCAILTPAIKMKLRAMESGQVLEVRVNDPDAKGDIEAWCRLSGNQLLEMSAEDGQQLRFFLKKK